MLDLKMLMVTTVIILICTTFGNLVWIYYSRNNKILKYLLGFNAGLLFGIFLMILRNKVPDFIAIVIANTVLIMAYVFLYIAISGLLKQDMKWHYRHYIPVVVMFLGFYLFTHIYYDGEMRIVIFSIFCVIFGLSVAWLFWKYAYGNFLQLHRLNAVIFLYSTGMFTYRAFTASTVEIPVSYFQVLVFPYLFLIFIIVWINALFLLQILIENKSKNKTKIS